MRAILGVLLGVACAGSARTEGTQAGGSMTAHTENRTGAPVEMKFVGLEPGRPPMLTLRFDVTLRNDAAEPRWFLFPVELAPSGRKAGGVDGVEVLQLAGEGRLVLGRFQGTGAVQAVRLPGKGTARVRRLGVLAFEDLPDGPQTVEVVVARELTVGGEPAAAWFGVDPTSDARTDVTGDQPRRLGSRHTPDRREVAIAWSEERTLSLTVNVTASPVH